MVHEDVARGELLQALPDWRLSIFGRAMYMLYMPNRHHPRAIAMMIEYILRRARPRMRGAAPQCATAYSRPPGTTMKKTLALLMCAALPAPAAAAQPDVEALKLNPQNKLYCNEQADWCVGIKLDGGFEDNGPFASSRSLRADYRIWDLPDIPNFSNFTVWPHLIRLSESAPWLA